MGSGSTKPQAAAEPASIVLDENVKLSDSKIWSLLEDYYKNASISAWNQIPFYPTSNPFIADAYADIIFSFLEDYSTELNYDEPLYILEMAAGTGCFSFYLLKEIERRVPYFHRFSKLKIKYVMADFTSDNPRNWSENAKLKPFVEKGLLHFGVFRPQDDLRILEFSAGASNEKVLIEKGVCKNPLIAIANYFFDSIKQDAFQLQDGKLFEVLNSFNCLRDASGGDSVAFDRLQKKETYRPVEFSYYSDDRLNKVLRSYSRDHENASIIFPVGAYKCISNLLEISEEKLVLISSDKGFTEKSYVKGLREQPFVAHHGVFSYSVNYDALRRYFEELGGTSFNTSDDNLSVSTGVNYLIKGSANRFERSHFNFADKVDRLNLINYLYFMQDLITEIEPKKSHELLRACLGYVQLCNYDPVVFCLAAPRMYFSLETMNSIQEKRILQMLERVRENFFSVQQQYDVFYWIGRIYYGMNHLDEALKAFADSLLHFGESSSALYYMAACYEVRKDYKTALRLYQDTLKLEPDCEYTQGGIKRVAELIEKGA